jgi:hypothetical protein
MLVRNRVVVSASEKGQKTASNTSPIDITKITCEIIEHENNQEHEPVENGDKSKSFCPRLNAWTEEDDHKAVGKAFQATTRLQNKVCSNVLEALGGLSK